MISKLNTKIVKKLISKSDNDKKKENKTVNSNQIIHRHNYSANQYVFQNVEETIQVKENTVDKDCKRQEHSPKDTLPIEIQGKSRLEKNEFDEKKNICKLNEIKEENNENEEFEDYRIKRLNKDELIDSSKNVYFNFENKIDETTIIDEKEIIKEKTQENKENNIAIIVEEEKQKEKPRVTENIYKRDNKNKSKEKVENRIKKSERNIDNLSENKENIRNTLINQSLKIFSDNKNYSENQRNHFEDNNSPFRKNDNIRITNVINSISSITQDKSNFPLAFDSKITNMMISEIDQLDKNSLSINENNSTISTIICKKDKLTSNLNRDNSSTLKNKNSSDSCLKNRVDSPSLEKGSSPDNHNIKTITKQTHNPSSDSNKFKINKTDIINREEEECARQIKIVKANQDVLIGKHDLVKSEEDKSLINKKMNVKQEEPKFITPVITSKKKIATKLIKEKEKSCDLSKNIVSKETNSILNSPKSENKNKIKEKQIFDKKLNNSKSGKYIAYDTQSQAYSIIRGITSRKIDMNSNFLQRMEEDVHNRHSKDKILNVIIEATKPKIDESQRINTFNRLINDANYRMEKHVKKKEEQNNVDRQYSKDNTRKTQLNNDWEKIYEERFKKFEISKEKKIKEMKKEKIIKQKQLEDEILKNPNLNKKATSKHIKEFSQKLYQDAEIRRVKIDQLKIKKEKLEQSISNKELVLKKPNVKDIIDLSQENSLILVNSFSQDSKLHMRGKSLNTSKSSEVLINSKNKKSLLRYRKNTENTFYKLKFEENNNLELTKYESSNILSSPTKDFRLKDMKTASSPKVKNYNYKSYMPETVANKLVDNIFQSKMNQKNNN